MTFWWNIFYNNSKVKGAQHGALLKPSKKLLI